MEARKSIEEKEEEAELTANWKQTWAEPINIKLITDPSTRVAAWFVQTFSQIYVN